MQFHDNDGHLISMFPTVCVSCKVSIFRSGIVLAGII